MKRVGLNEVEEDDVDLLLESIGEGLSTEKLKGLEKQRHQLEEEVEAEQHPMVPHPKQMTVKILQGFYRLLKKTFDYMEEMDPDYEWLGLKRHRVLEELSCYEHLLYEKRKTVMQSTLDSWFKKKPSHPEASATDEPHTSEEPYTSDEPQASTSTGGYTHPNVPTPLPLPSSDADNPDVV